MIGTTLGGKYVVSRQLGEGGMGAVFEARHTGTGRRVAVKVIMSRLGQDELVMSRFTREARAAGAIESEHIAQVFDIGRDLATGYPFLVMELLNGEDVGQLLGRIGPLRPELALRILAQACMGLRKAHDAGVMHRDIKPANLFLARHDGGQVSVKLLDFGVAKIKMEEATSDQAELTAPSALIGSPVYMSPEQARCLKDIDFRTDVWSLGVVLYKMLSGRTPYEEVRALGALLFSICSRPSPPVQHFAPWVPAEVAAIVHCALQIDRTRRFQSAAAMLDAVKALLPNGFALQEEALGPITERERANVAPALELSTPGSVVAPVNAVPSRPSTSSIGWATLAGVLGYGAGDVASGADDPALARRHKARARLAAGAALLLGCAVAAWGWATVDRAPAAPAEVTSPAAPPSSPHPLGGELDPERLASFGALPTVVTSVDNPLTEEKISLGRMLFYDVRLSKSRAVSCNSCHPLDRYGADTVKASIGHAGQSSSRNAPSVYNAASYFALFWDGRSATLEEQAKVPWVGPDATAVSASQIEATLRSIPDYAKAFSRAFPADNAPISMANVARAIAAFERRLFTPGRWDRYLEGERSALTDAEKAGFNAFVETGCVSCHFSPLVGATMYQKLGLVRAWADSMDRGRFELTQRPTDFMVFRVPSLRNVAATAPYFHDGSIASLEEAVRLMAKHQLGKDISAATVTSITTWLRCLSGDPPRDYVQKPAFPERGSGAPPP